MKKILAILISLIFVVTSLSAVSGFCDPPANICAGVCLGCYSGDCSDDSGYCIISGPSVVQVGDTITVRVIGKDCNIDYEAFLFCDYFEIEDFEAAVSGTSEGCKLDSIITLRALRPGIVGATFSCNDNKLHITITPKEYPMQQIMGILDKNKN